MKTYDWLQLPGIIGVFFGIAFALPNVLGWVRLGESWAWVTVLPILCGLAWLFILWYWNLPEDANK